MKKTIKTLLAATLVFGLISCEKEEDDSNNSATNSETTGEFNMDFNYVWGMNMAEFNLNDTLIHQMTGDTLAFNTFKHYVSNIKLTKDDGSVWSEEESYHLIDLSDPSTMSLNISNVPTGNYTSIEVTFGVDSTRNVSGAQSGALDVVNGMFWSWNSGYIMLKAEGISPNSADGTFAYHLGGFSGENSVVTTKEFTLSSDLEIEENHSHTVNVNANPAKLFHTFGSVSNGSFHMPGENAKTMADDFYGWINVSNVE